MAIQLLGDGTSQHKEKYEWKSASVNVAGTDGEVNIRTITGFTTLFDTLKRASHIRVEASAAAYIRVNSASADKITLGATTPFEADMVASKLFISTGGSAVTITVKLH